jgi:glucokinase
LSPGDGRDFVGIEIGGTKLQLALGPGDGTITALERRLIRPEAGAKGLLDQILEAYDELIARRPGHETNPTAIGIGFGGPVDVDRGVILRSHQVEGWDGFDLADWCRTSLNVPLVAIQNDADTAGLGEARFGAGRGLSPIFYVTIGSGIGGGLVIDGRIYRGSGLGAAEIGHLWIDEPGSPPRRLEDIASGWSIGRAGREVLGEGSAVDTPLVAQAAAAGDPRASAILATATRSLGRALAHMATLLAPRRIILGGGVSLLGEDAWFRPIREELDARVFPPFRGSFDVVPALLGEAVVLHGALALARDLDDQAGRSGSDKPIHHSESIDPEAVGG